MLHNKPVFAFSTRRKVKSLFDSSMIFLKVIILIWLFVHGISLPFNPHAFTQTDARFRRVRMNVTKCLQEIKTGDIYLCL